MQEQENQNNLETEAIEVLVDEDGQPVQMEGQDEDGMFEHKRFVADPGQRLMRLDQWLATIMKQKSRTMIKNATTAGCVRVNGKTVKPAYKVKPGDQVTIVFPHPPPPRLAPEELPLNLEYEDDELIILNKQPGMVVHPGVGNHTGTMVHGLLYHLNLHQLDAPREDWAFPMLCHRIDKDTTGLLVIAKTEFANHFLSRQFYERTIDRLYNAIVWGDVKEDEGTIVGHVGRSKGDRKKFIVYKDGSQGKHAVTHYKVLERFGFATLVQCKLETGRTHQIRVHLKSIGHTLLADWFYGGDAILVRKHTPKYEAFIRNLLKVIPRQALHARTLGFTHPKTKKTVLFNSDLPDDFIAALEKMRNYRKAYLE